MNKENKVFGKTIKIYLPDGNPKSIKIAEITSRTVKAVLVPRSKLGFALEREELANPGIYFLIGNPEESDKRPLYIGETENCIERLKQHNQGKEFWDYAVVIISTNSYFTKTHIRYLEHYCYKIAAKANRFHLTNKQVPKEPAISEPENQDMFDFFETIEILTATLGYNFFEIIERVKDKDILVCSGKDAYAEGEYIDGAIIVFKGAKFRKDHVKSFQSYSVNFRSKLISEKKLAVNGEEPFYLLLDDYTFSSVSSASDIILGRSSNGWIEWKHKTTGKKLSEIVERSK